MRRLELLTAAQRSVANTLLPAICESLQRQVRTIRHTIRVAPGRVPSSQLACSGQLGSEVRQSAVQAAAEARSKTATTPPAKPAKRPKVIARKTTSGLPMRRLKVRKVKKSTQKRR